MRMTDVNDVDAVDVRKKAFGWFTAPSGCGLPADGHSCWLIDRQRCGLRSGLSGPPAIRPQLEPSAGEQNNS